MIAGPLTADEQRALAEIEDALRFAMRPRSRREIAERLGVADQTIRAREIRALAKMRRIMAWRGVDVRPADLERSNAANSRVLQTR